MALISSTTNIPSGGFTALTISPGQAAATNPANNTFVPALIDYAQYLVNPATGSGTLTFFELCVDGVYRQLQTPAPVLLTPNAGNFSGGLGGSTHGPFLGLQAIIQGTGSGPMTYFHLKGTTRP